MLRVALRKRAPGCDAQGLGPWIARLLPREGFPALRSVDIARTPAGKPFFPQHPQIRFNPSDSGGWRALAVSETTEVGIDIERVRTVPRAEAIARRFTGPGWLPADEPERSAVFLREWTIREALVKATGEGLSGVGRLTEVDAPEGGLRGFTDPAGDLWTARHVDLPGVPELVCAVAGRGRVAVASIRVDVGESAASAADLGQCGARGCG
jgi:phosphopantetheinyl transferase